MNTASRKEDKKTDRQPDAGELSFKKQVRISVKLILGVAAASNICILMLLYSIWQWDIRVNDKSNRLVEIQKDLNMELRESVTKLQKRLLKLPSLLETDPGQRVLN